MKIQANLLVEINKHILKFTQKGKLTKVAKTILKKNEKIGGSHYLILCSYSNQDTVNFGGRIETYINGTEQSLQVDPQNNSQNIK